MADVTVTQFAEVLKVPVDKLLAQLDEAGIKVSGSTDTISDEAKLELLTHLRRSHGQDASHAGDPAPRQGTGRPVRQGAGAIRARRPYHEEVAIGGLQATIPPGATMLSIDEILKILPHRYPFLMVDGVSEVDSHPLYPTSTPT